MDFDTRLSSKQEWDAKPLDEILRGPSLSLSYRDFLATTTALTLDMDVNTVRGQVESNTNSVNEELARSQAHQTVSISRDVSVNALTRLGASVEQVSDVVESSDGAQDAISNTLDPVFAANVYKELSTMWTESDRRQGLRLANVARMVEEKVGETDTSLLGLGWQFVDAMASALPDAITGGGFARSNDAQEIWELSQDPNISDEEFNERARALVDSVADTGIFTDSNSFYAAGFLDSILQGPASSERVLDKAFTVTDIAGSALTGGSLAVRGFTRIRDGVDFAKTFGSYNDAVKVTEGAIAEASPGVNVEKRLGGLSFNQPQGGASGYISPDAQALHNINLSSSYFDAVEKQHFGSFVDPDMLDAVSDDIISNMRSEAHKTATRNVMDVGVYTDGLGNPFARAVFGKVDGTPFKSLAGATKFAKNIGGEVVSDVVEGEVRFVVALDKPIPTREFVRATSADELSNSILGTFGSTYLTTSSRLDVLAKRGEAGLENVLAKLQKDYLTSRRKLRGAELKALNGVFERLRDGDDSFRSTHYSTDEFRDAFKALSGQEPRPEVVDTYLKLVQLNDADFVMRADPAFKRAVNEGVEVLTIESLDNINYKVAEVAGDVNGRKAFNVLTGTEELIEEFSQGTTYRVFGGVTQGDKSYELLFVPHDVPFKKRRLYHSDVLGYNPGGHRENVGGNWFIKQDKRLRDAETGTEILGNPVTLMVAQTEKEARRASELLEMVRQTMIREMPRNLKRDDAIEWIGQSVGDDVLSAAVRELGDVFGGQIEDAEDFVNWFTSHNLDPRREINFAFDGEELLKQNPDTLLDEFRSGGFTSGATYREASLRYHNPAGTRRVEKLRTVGWNEVETKSPVEAIENGYAQALSRISFQGYFNQAAEGLWKSVRGLVSDPDRFDNLSPLRRLEELDGNISTATENGRKFENERKVILRRAQFKTKGHRAYLNRMQRTADWVYDKTGSKFGQNVADWRFVRDPLTAIRGWAFDAKLGLFAFDQTFVQASQIVNILAVSPLKDWRQVVMPITPLRWAVGNGNDEVARAIAKRQAAFTGLTEDEFMDVYQMIKDSGRLEVGKTATELADGEYYMFKSQFNRFREAGRVFFNEGEKIPRVAAFISAYKDAKRRFPNADITSRVFQDEVFKRQDVLTAGMTRMSAAPWQRNALSVPFQFMSYTTRMLEQIVLGAGGLTAAERSRILGAQMAAFGTAGLGMGKLFEELAASDTTPTLDPVYHTAMRYGILDALIGEFTSADTAFASRLGIGEGLSDAIDRFADMNIFEAAGGPSVQFANDAALGFYDQLVAVRTGSFDLNKQALGNWLRSISSVNRQYNTYMLWKYGEYYSRKTGSLIAQDLGVADAIFNAIGAPLQDVNIAYDVLSRLRDEEKDLREVGTKIKQNLRLADKLARELGPDHPRVQAVMEEVKFQMLPFYENPSHRQFLRQFTDPEWESLFDTAMRKLWERHPHYAEQLELVTEDQ